MGQIQIANDEGRKQVRKLTHTRMDAAGRIEVATTAKMAHADNALN